MSWRVETLNTLVDEEIASLAVDVQASLAHVSELIMSQGLHNVGQKYIKHLDGKLWELRLHGRDGIARAIYVTALGERVVIVHAFVKKTQKTPSRALAIARQRAKEVR